MLKGILTKVAGDSNEREVRKLQSLVTAINSLEPDMERRTAAELRMLTEQFQMRLSAGEVLDDILVEAFAAVREIAKRLVDMRPFDVQLIGGIVLHQGRVAEMKTGEGKTLVATMPVYLNALTRRGVHLVTVNDYLARRDVLWMGPIYHALGLAVGLLQSGVEQPAYLYDPDYEREPYPGLRPAPRQEAYAADITYGTNNEFGFDYLRDNLALSLEHRVQRPLYYAIVDEVDNIFIDEARTPLIISGASGEPVEEYSQFAAIARRLEPQVHYELDEKERSVYLTDEGLAVVEQETGIENIYDEANYRYVHYMQQALKAQVLFAEGRDYIRQRKQIILIDQHTGRLMPSRRLSEGLHQAIEAKEGVPIQPRDVTSATITIQNYFRMYEKLAGMSGTAVTESEEFFKIYKLDVVAIPTHKPVIRVDHADVVYRGEEAKLRAVVRELLDCHSRGQPVLVGTTSVDMSERLSRRLTGERLQMAALSPRIAYALQDASLSREERSSLRETMNANLETMNSAAWRRMARALNVDPNGLAEENLTWAADYLSLDHDPAARRALERALRDGIPHSVLNAKEHTREAAIIARAGEPGAVTIATNMAGRGVDIKLGGELSDEVIHKAHVALEARGLDPFAATPAQMDSAIAEVAPDYAKRREQVLAAGGLHVLGTERHEARRIDNQLRGRSGRQGEPGSSRFFLSLEDDLMRRFGRRDMLAKLMEQMGDDFPIEHGLVSKTIERAQTSVEGYNFDIRKHLLEYDDVLNRQRDSIYGERLRILRSADLHAETWRLLEAQVDEYLEKYAQDAEQQRLLFASLDDIAPLVLPAPKGPFSGILAFGHHLTAFPPFTISFLSDQLAGQPHEQVRAALSSGIREAAAGYGEQTRNAIKEVAQVALDKYSEHLDRYRALVDEKIEDYRQLAEERGQAVDVRRLAQHLDRTYPLKLTTPSELYAADEDTARDHWLAQVEIEYHRLTSLGVIDRVWYRLPPEVQSFLQRAQPAQVPADRLNEECRRILELADGQRKTGGVGRSASLPVPQGADSDQVLRFVEAVKQASDLDYGRLDRLVGHVLGAGLHDLLDQYLAALQPEQGRLCRELEKLQSSLQETRKTGRGNDLLGFLRQLTGLVHLEIADIESLLEPAVGHAYDKWAQRQVAEFEDEAGREPLTGTSWSEIAEHLLAVYYTQRQVFDRGHQRRATWIPRLPLGYVAQVQVQDLDRQALRDRLLSALHWTLEQREQAWGRQEFQRWSHLATQGLSQETYDSLTRFLGQQQLGDLGDRAVEDLPRDLYDRLRFILALRRLQDRQPRVGELPQAESILDHLAQALETQLMAVPIGQLDAGLRAQISAHLRQSGYLDDAEARSRFVQGRIQDWDRRTRDEVAAFLGRRFIAAHKEQALHQLQPEFQQATLAYLEAQHRFVDEERLQQFLVHGRLADLPPETRDAALQNLARSHLERVSRRKIANLDPGSRQFLSDLLQRLGWFTDQTRRDRLLPVPLAELEPRLREGFTAFLARQHIQGHRLSDLEPGVQQVVVDRLRAGGVLIDQQQREQLLDRRVMALDPSLAAQLREDLMAQLRAELAVKTMEDLPAETSALIHQILDNLDYFVDQDKANWYERKTLAQLPPDLLRKLEQHMGQIRLTELAGRLFRDLAPEVQAVVLDLLDRESLLPDRAARLRLTQAGSLDELSETVRERIAQHLGRRWLVEIRDRRPASLADGDRQVIWAYLRSQGHFSDAFKEELFQYQRLDEFDKEVQEAVERALGDRLDSVLRSHTIGTLPPDLQVRVQDWLRRNDYFLDPARLRQVRETPVDQLSPDLQQAVQGALGAYLWVQLDNRAIGELALDIQMALWGYLDEVGYFLDEEKQASLLDRRLVDLGSDFFETTVQEYILSQTAAIGELPVSDLGEGLRQALREAVERTGFFESAEERRRLLRQPIAALRREDQDLLAAEYGRVQLEHWADHRLVDLDRDLQDAVLAHLQERDWFVDQQQLGELLNRSVGDLEERTRRELVARVRQQYVERLRNRPLSSLDRGLRVHVDLLLQAQGLALDEAQMRPLQHRRVDALEQDAYDDLLRHLGAQVVADWGHRRFGELGQDQQQVVSSFLGRMIMADIERRVLLYTISRLWIDYLTDIEDLRRGIGLEAYGQRDPLVEYKRRAFELFEELGKNIQRESARTLLRQPPQPLDID
jgi:preprotein translocase subunit SecA